MLAEIFGDMLEAHVYALKVEVKAVMKYEVSLDMEVL